MQIQKILSSITFIMTTCITLTGAQKATEIVHSEADLVTLLNTMTLEEKVGQMVQFNGSWDVTGPLPGGKQNQARYKAIKAGLVGSMLNVLYYEDIIRMQKYAVEETRLGIPLIFGHDVIHGFETSFPVPLAESATFNLELIEASARLAAVESAAAGINWTFAPMVDVSRDPRWGRVMEGAGEDTWWGVQVAKARVHGFQGDDLGANDTIAACAKHFAGYGYIEAGRDYNHAEISAWRLKNDILPPFEACVEAGVATFMNSFNTILGVPATASHYLLRNTLKDEWDFKGFVVSDWASISEMIPHGFAKDLEHAAEIAINAGSDMDMEGYAYSSYLEDLVKQGVVDQALVDDAVLRILKLKYDLGLFEDPYRYLSEQREKDMMRKSEFIKKSGEIARESMVLLKNDKKTLPLSKKSKKIALIGPLAKDKDSPLGNWRSQAAYGSAVSLYEGLSASLPKGVELLYHEGCILNTVETKGMFDQVVINREDRSGIQKAAEVASEADVIIAAVGEVGRMSGEARSYANIHLPGVQLELMEALYATGKPVVVVLFSGRPLVIPEMADRAASILEAWNLGEESGHAIADVLLGKVNPSGKLPMSFPHHEGQIPVYYNCFNTGRPGKGATFGPVSHFDDIPNKALYPFGHGLSYSNFKYGSVALNTTKKHFGESLLVRVEIENASDWDGKEVVQLYIRDLVGSTVRPLRELKGAQKCLIRAHDKKTVEFEVTDKDLGFYNAELNWVVEPGRFEVFVGGSSETENSAGFELIL